MDLTSRYRTTIDQLKQTRDFIKNLNPVDYKLSMFASSLDSEINKAEEMLTLMTKGISNLLHRCEFCDRPYDEETPVVIEGLKICPICRTIGESFQLGSVLEEKYDLPTGTIKRDCVSKAGSPAKLQAFIDTGLIYKSGIHYMVNIKVMELYYNNPNVYKRRSRRKNTDKPTH